MKNTLSRRRLKSRMEGTSVVLPPQESWRRVCHRPPLRPTYSSCSKRNVYSHCWKHSPLELSFATHISINTILSSRARQDHNIFQYSAGSGVNELWQRVQSIWGYKGPGPLGVKKEGRMREKGTKSPFPWESWWRRFGDTYWRLLTEDGRMLSFHSPFVVYSLKVHRGLIRLNILCGCPWKEF